MIYGCSFGVLHPPCIRCRAATGHTVSKQARTLSRSIFALVAFVVPANGSRLNSPPISASWPEPGAFPLRICILTLYSSVTNHSEREHRTA